MWVPHGAVLTQLAWPLASDQELKVATLRISRERESAVGLLVAN